MTTYSSACVGRWIESRRCFTYEVPPGELFRHCARAMYFRRPLSRLGYARKVNFALDAVNGMEEAITLKLPRVTVICRVTPRSIIAFSYPFSCTSRRLPNFHSVYGISISSRDLAPFNAFLRLTSLASLCLFSLLLNSRYF